MLPVECAVMHYSWGTMGSASLVARLASVGRMQRIDETLPFAEMWIGAHPSGPAMVATEQYRMLEMSAWMERRYWSSSTMYRKHALPFLMPVLSVRSALSIQAHPDKKEARRLHELDPEHYKNDNHKPELACAVSEFEALCSFRPAADLLANAYACPKLVELVGMAAVDALKMACDVRGEDSGEARAALRQLYASMMRSPDKKLQASLNRLIARLEMGCASPAEALALRLHRQYPGDVGVFCAFLLNHIVLAPGDAVFLAANEPHAYLRGDCVECMACSDNVVRAGLTSKFKDVDVLCDMLTYTMGQPMLLEAIPSRNGPVAGHVYRPPVPEFQLRRLTTPRGQSGLLAATPSVGTLLCCEGHGHATDSAGHRFVLRPGFTMLVLPDTRVTFEAQSDMLLFICQEQAGTDRVFLGETPAAAPAAAPSTEHPEEAYPVAQGTNAPSAATPRRVTFETSTAPERQQQLATIPTLQAVGLSAIVAFTAGVAVGARLRR